MMKGKLKGKSKKFLSLVFATFMLSATAASFVACGGSSSSSEVDDSEVTVTEKDDARIKNGNFEFYDDNDGKNLIVTSTTNWTNSVGSSSKGSASKSQAASGIVDTANWETFSKTSGLAHDTVENATKNWDNLTVRDQLEFIYNWEEEDSDNDVEDLSFYDEDADIFNYNVKFKDLPTCENPGTPLGEDAGDDTGILMIHNKATDNVGTAQKYTSSSTVTLQPGTSAEFSVWVKTADLKNANTNGDSQESLSERGAYIGVTNTVAGSTLDQIQIKNIISDEWKQYSFYLKGNTYAETTFTIVLGLGQGGGNTWEYVEGYAFFDDVQCKVVKNEAYEAANTSFDHEVKLGDLAADKILRADTAEYADLAVLGIDLSKEFFPSNFNKSAFEVEQTTEDKFDTLPPFTAGFEETTNDLYDFYTYDELETIANDNSNAFFSSSFEKDFENYPFEQGMLLLYSASGAPYTAQLKGKLEMPKEAYYVLSFWVKTSDLSGGFTGGGVKMTESDGTETNIFSALSTNAITKVNVDGENGEEIEDIYDGWQQCFIFFANGSEETKSFELSFTYGPTSIATTSKDAYREGYVAFADVQMAILEKDEYSKITATTYSKTVDLGDETASGKGKFDDAAAVPSDLIETGFAPLANYDGVTGGSSYVSWNGTACEKNAYEYAGLLSQEYVSNYANVLPDTATVSPQEILNGANQPLVIYNNEEMAYGYIGKAQTITAGEYGTVALRVKASVDAIANVYLIEKTDAGYEDALNVSTLKYTYYYDADGNVCSEDPTDSSFGKKDIAFYRKANGLYEANKNWTGYTADMAGKLYANLQNYEKDPETGNLLVADGGVSYNYDSSVWSHAGNNGVAFYAKDKDTAEYYAYASKKAEDRVYDLASVEGLARYADNAKTGVLSMTVVGTGDWVECFFYVHVGDQDKSYRLEVWSGSRDGETKNAADSYVAFETINWVADATTYESILKENVEKAQGDLTDEEFKDTYADVAYTTFSFFDSAKFLRYDETLDKDGVGNSYDDYDATTYTEGLVYFSYTDSDLNRTSKFVDFSFTEIDVPVDADAEDDDDHDHDHDHDAETTTDGMNIWLLVSSLALAAVLLLAIVSLIVQRAVRSYRKKHPVAEKVQKVKAKKEAKEAKAAAKAEAPKKEVNKDENDPYND